MEYRILNAVFGHQREITTRKLYQYDYGQELQFFGLNLPDVFEVHFSNTDSSGAAKTAIGQNDTVVIPDEYLETGLPVYAWVFLHDEQTDGETEYKVTIPVVKRPKTTNEEPTPVQQDVITQTIAALNTAAKKAEDEAERAESAADLLSHPDAVANTLAPGSSATASYADGTFTFGIPQGLKGDKGDTGEPGAKGDRGEKGDKGDQGERGEQGIQGVPGEKGEKGDRGEQGVQGEQGIQGEKGDKGDTGETGATGAKGDPGEGIATGGTPGQALIKASTADYATRWMSILPEDTASGSVASFPDGADDLPMGVVVDIDPVQDLHGYDNPWPAGGGKNKFDVDKRVNTAAITVSNGVITVTGNAINSTKMLKEIADVVVGETYVLTADTTGNDKLIYLHGSGANTSWTFGTQKVITQEIADALVMFYGGASSTSQITNMMIRLASVSDATFAPYSNVCPISGWTGAKVTRTGRNLLDYDSFENKTINAPGVESTATTRLLSGLIDVKPNVTYFISFPTGYKFIGFCNYDASGNWVSNVFTNNSVGVPIVPTSPKIKLYFQRSDNGNITKTELATAQLELGSTAHAYEPYQGVTHEIPFSTEVYGGTLNVETGELVVDRAKVVYDGTQLIGLANWRANSESVGWLYSLSSTPNIITDTLVDTNLDNVVSDTLKTVIYVGSSGLYGTKIPSISIIGGTSWGIGMRMNDTSLTTNAAINAWLSQHPVTVVYKLATLITLTLTPVEIRSLLGNNNVWSDTGDVSVTYKADIQKYIDKKISAAVAAMS